MFTQQVSLQRLGQNTNATEHFICAEAVPKFLTVTFIQAAFPDSHACLCLYTHTFWEPLWGSPLSLVGMCFSHVRCVGVKKKGGWLKTTLLKTHVDSSSLVVGTHRHRDSHKEHHCKRYAFFEGHSLIKAEISCASSDL